MRNEKSISKFKEIFQLLINHLRYSVHEIDDDYIDILTKVFQMNSKYEYILVLILRTYNGEPKNHIGYIDNELTLQKLTVLNK